MPVCSKMMSERSFRLGYSAFAHVGVVRTLYFDRFNDKTYPYDKMHNLPEIGLYPFAHLSKDYLWNLCLEIFMNKLGWGCTLKHLLPKDLCTGIINIDDCVNYLKSLHITEVTRIDEYSAKTVFTSTLDGEKRTFYTHVNPTPQKATDTVVFTTNEKGLVQYTILATKKKSPTVVVVNTTGEEITLLSVGMTDKFVLAGEHLEGNESDIWPLAYEAQVNGPKLLTGVGTNPSVRTLAEEVDGNLVSSGTYITGVHSKEGRDTRYGAFDYYGIEDRGSESVTFIAIVKNFTPKDMAPLDAAECGKPLLVDVATAIAEFKEGGMLQPAFHSHPDMFNIAVDLVKANPELFDVTF